MIKRELEKKIKKLAAAFPAIAILGPRQSGKTTLAKATFPNYKYITLENLSNRERAIKNPIEFLNSLKKEKGVILDEIQNVPDLFSYMQEMIDEENKMGFFILTGSQNFLLNQSISQTLAGRISIQTLLPLSTSELEKANLLPQESLEYLVKGSYPRLYDTKAKPEDWYNAYIQTYIEKDVRLIKNVTDLSLFQKFIQLCAGRIGQILNVTSLSNDVGVSTTTIKNWLSILEQSYIIFLLQPHYKNFSKRLIKSPKIYFYDTGLAANLLGIENEGQLITHYLVGGLFESFVASELLKSFYNNGKRPRLYFWRDRTGHEVDFIIDKAQNLLRVEVKSTKTIMNNLFDGLKQWQKISGIEDNNNFLVYRGDEDYKRSIGRVIGWKSIKKILK
ncbi:MAG: ATP-binding protein [bacterium]